MRQLIRDELEAQRRQVTNAEKRMVRWEFWETKSKEQAAPTASTTRRRKRTRSRREVVEESQPPSPMMKKALRTCFGCSQPGHLVIDCHGPALIQPGPASGEEPFVTVLSNRVHCSSNAYLSVKVNGKVAFP